MRSEYRIEAFKKAKENKITPGVAIYLDSSVEILNKNCNRD